MLNKSILVGLSVWILSLQCLAISSQRSPGGNELGNGGDVFYCTSSSGVKVILVDIYEATRAGRKINLGSSSKKYKERVKEILNAWSELSPIRVAQYLKWLETFENEATFDSGVELPNISDEGIVLYPNGCQIRQIAIQLADSNLGTGYKRYTINKDLWDLLDEGSKAALVLHELIFREAILARQPVSLRVRYLNGIFFSESTIREYFEASKNLNGLFLEWGAGGVQRGVGGGLSFSDCTWKGEKHPDCDDVFVSQYFVEQAGFKPICFERFVFGFFSEIKRRKVFVCQKGVDAPEKYLKNGILNIADGYSLDFGRPITISYLQKLGAFRFKVKKGDILKISSFLLNYEVEFLEDGEATYGMNYIFDSENKINNIAVSNSPAVNLKFHLEGAEVNFQCEASPDITVYDSNFYISFKDKSGRCALNVQGETSAIQREFENFKYLEFGVTRAPSGEYDVKIKKYDAKFEVKLGTETSLCSYYSQSAKELYLVCKSLPRKILCQVPVYKKDQVVEYKIEELFVRSGSYIWLRNDGAIGIDLGPDQIVRYNRGFFGDQGVKLEEEKRFYLNDWTEAGCRL